MVSDVYRDPSPGRVRKFSYREECMLGGDVLDFLNEEGAQGWRCAAVYPHQNTSWVTVLLERAS